MDETNWREQLARSRERLRQQYATFRKLAQVMRSKGWIRWSDKHHEFYSEFLNDHPWKTRETIKQLLKLQSNLGDQAMLLLEMEHSIDCEEKKQKEAA